MLSERQKARISALRREGSLSHEDVLDLAEEISGSSVTDLDDLDSSEGSTLIERLEDGRI
jgi:hypothetical protein